MGGRFLLLCILISLSGVAQGQIMWDDSLNDAEVSYVPWAFEPTPDAWIPLGPNPSYDFADVTSIGILEETDDALIFSVTVRGVSGIYLDTQLGRMAEYAVNFTFGGNLHNGVFVYDRMEKDMAFELVAFDGIRWYSVFRTAAEEMSPGSWKATMPKSALRDLKGLPAVLGGTLEQIHAAGYRSSRPFDTELYSPYQCPGSLPEFEKPSRCGYRYRDLIDNGNALGDYELLKAQTGELFVETIDPIRYSNGLESTYIYEIQVGNPTGTAKLLQIDVENIPENWIVNVPREVIVESSGSLSFPLAISVPFVHQHGSTELLEVVLSENGVQQGRTMAGVTWPEIPQPSGHHSRLFLHGDGDRIQWINTIEEDPKSAEEVPGLLGGIGVMATGKTHQFRWSMPLSPGLQIGIDGDMNRAMEGALAFSSTIDADAELVMELRLVDSIGQEHVLTKVEHDTLQLRAQQILEVDLEGEMKSLWDFISPDDDQNLELSILLYLRPSPAAGADPTIAVGLQAAESWLDLPLLEFQDLSGLDANFDPALSAVAKPLLRSANPGGQVLIQYEIKNEGPAVTLDFNVLGSLQAAAQVEPSRVKISEGGSATVGVYVEVPEFSQHGDRLTFFLYGTEKNSDVPRFFAPSHVEVRTDEVFLDEEAPDKNKESPALAIPLVVILLVLASRRMGMNQT